MTCKFRKSRRKGKGKENGLKEAKSKFEKGGVTCTGVVGAERTF